MASVLLRSLPLAARVAWVPLVVCAMGLMEQSAQASCGDYVHIGGQLPADVEHLAAAKSHSIPAVPCQGPTCRARMPEPFTPPAPPPVMTAPSDLLAETALAAPGLAHGWRRLSSEPLSLPQPGSDIFHPPRSRA